MKTKGKKVTKKSVPVYNHGGRIRPEDLVVGRSYNYLLEPNTKVKYLKEQGSNYIFVNSSGQWVAIAPSELEDSISMVMENGGSFMDTSGLESQVRLGEKRFEKEVEAIDAFEAFISPKFKSKFNTDYNRMYVSRYPKERQDFIAEKRIEFLRLHPEYSDYLEKGGSLYAWGGLFGKKKHKPYSVTFVHTPTGREHTLFYETEAEARSAFNQAIKTEKWVSLDKIIDEKKNEKITLEYNKGVAMEDGGPVGGNNWIVLYTCKETGAMKDETFSDEDEANEFAEQVDSEAIPVKYEKGGKIANQYENRSPENIWDSWDITQRTHFLEDHRIEIPQLMEHGKFIERVLVYNKSSYQNLPEEVRDAIMLHVHEGEYAKGGKLSHYFGKAKEYSGKAYHAAKHHGTKAYHATKEGTSKAYHATKKYTEDKIHEQKKNVAIGVLESTRGSVASKDEAKSLKRAIDIVEEKYAQGGKMCPVGMKYQSLIFSKDNFSKAEAIAWAKKHDFKAIVDEKPNSYRMRQVSPSKFRAGSFRTIPFTTGVEAVIGCPAGVSGKKVSKKMENGGAVPATVPVKQAILTSDYYVLTRKIPKKKLRQAISELNKFKYEGKLDEDKLYYAATSPYAMLAIEKNDKGELITVID